MKILLILLILFLFSCETQDNVPFEKKDDSPSTKMNIEKSKETPRTKKNQDYWQQGFGLTHNIDQDSIWKKPVRYYVENEECTQIAIDFYLGKFRPTDNDQTEELLNLVLTKNTELRPFYRWILNKTIIIQDGALGEYTGLPARKYAERFPNEFFDYLDIEKSNEKYQNWCNSIMYSGFYDYDDYDNLALVRKEFAKTMMKNCTSCSKSTNDRIKKFANDCFPDALKYED